jgi:hypothetical protein
MGVVDGGKIIYDEGGTINWNWDICGVCGG